MNQTDQQFLNQWLSDCFERSACPSKHLESFKKIFMAVKVEYENDFSIDILSEQGNQMFDIETPEHGTFCQALEESVNDNISYFLQAIEDGHTVAYAEIYAQHAALGTDDASQEAYNRLKLSNKATKGDPSYQDCFQVCLHQGHSEQYAEWCANVLFDEEFNLSQAMAWTKKYEAAYLSKQREGRSELFYKCYAQRVMSKDSEQFAEIFAECYEDQIHQGQSEQTAWLIADHYTDLYDQKPCPKDYDDPDKPWLNDWTMAYAQAALRFTSPEPPLSKVEDTFLQISLQYRSLTALSEQAFYDEIESLTRKVYAQELALTDIPGFEKPASDTDSDSQAEYTINSFPNTEADQLRESEQNFRQWCHENDCDPEDESARESYKEIRAETGQAFWDNLDDDERDGYESMMTDD